MCMKNEEIIRAFPLQWIDKPFAESIGSWGLMRGFDFSFAFVDSSQSGELSVIETAVALKQQLPDQKPFAKSLDKLILLVLKT